MLFKRKGRITHPRNSASVPRIFQAEGTIDSVPANQHLVLVVSVGGLMWPKGKVEVDGTSWTCQVYEGGTPPDGRFALALYLVGDQGYDRVAAWLARGELTGSYPGLEQIPDSVRLHAVRLHLEPEI